MISHDYGVVGNLLGNEFHPRVLERLTKHRVTEYRYRTRKLIKPEIYLQSLSATPELRMRIAGYGKSCDVTYSVDRICALGGLIQEIEVFDLFSSPL